MATLTKINIFKGLFTIYSQPIASDNKKIKFAYCLTSSLQGSGQTLRMQNHPKTIHYVILLGTCSIKREIGDNCTNINALSMVLPDSCFEKR